MTAIVKGEKVTVNWMWQLPSGQLMTEFFDERPMPEVVAAWESAGTIKRKSENEGDAVYNGCNIVSNISRQRIGGKQVYTLSMVASL